MNTPVFPKHDPASPDFWEVRYREQFAPWDAGRTPRILAEYVQAASTPEAVLVPGCGSAWEVRTMAEAGWNVTAIDFSPAAVEAAQAALGPWRDKVMLGNFFGPALRPASFDVIYERAFLCALPRRMWRDWAARTAELLKPGGKLIGYFYSDDGERGPPFGLKSGELETLLAPSFSLVETRQPDDSIAVFRDKEQWMVWKRTV